jgi:5-(carboxyamino)imidazole ribonucleotide mutase
VAVNGAMNAAILAVQMMATGDETLMLKLVGYKESLKQKIVKANEELSEVKYNFKTN